MEYRQLGCSGARVSVVGLGANRFGSQDVLQAEVTRIIDAALDTGVNFIDTANTYIDGRSEETLGNALKGRMDRVVMATKFSFPRKASANSWGASRYHMMQAVEKSLRRLQTDHIDLYYCHRWDDTAPIEETLRGLDDLIRMGKVCYIGASFCNLNTTCSSGTLSAKFCLTAGLVKSALFHTIRWREDF
jgi:aryl-alcohol dehydrogenase-like predicted oxidoreductase